MSLTIRIECNGCPDDMTIDGEDILYYDPFAVSLGRQLKDAKWAEIHRDGREGENNLHFCPLCVNYIKERTSDDELSNWGISPAEAKRWIDGAESNSSSCPIIKLQHGDSRVDNDHRPGPSPAPPGDALHRP